MEQVEVTTAAAQVPQLLEMVQAGLEIVLVEAGLPIAKIVPVTRSRPRLPGRWAGRLWVAEDFDAALPDAMMPGMQ